jgi:hypothetical protein
LCVSYAVRGPVLDLAMSLQKRLDAGEKLPFSEIIYCNIGTCARCARVYLSMCLYVCMHVCMFVCVCLLCLLCVCSWRIYCFKYGWGERGDPHSRTDVVLRWGCVWLSQEAAYLCVCVCMCVRVQATLRA